MMAMWTFMLMLSMPQEIKVDCSLRFLFLLLAFFFAFPLPATAINGTERQATGTQQAKTGVAAATTVQDAIRLTSPRKARQGSVVRVRASVRNFSPHEEPIIIFSWLDKSVRASAVPVNGRQEAEMLVPVPVNAKKALTVRAETADKRQRAKTRIAVVPVAWPEQQLNVNAKYVAPPPETMQRIEAERRLSREALSRISPERLWRDFVRPVPGAVTSAFGGRRMFNGKLRSIHRGVDLRGAEGSPIRALASGRVILAESMYYGGNTVYLDHGQGVISIYCHMSVMDVRSGDTVQAGDVLGKVGSTGRVTGPHLHLGLIIHGQAADPLSLFPPSKPRKKQKSWRHSLS